MIYEFSNFVDNYSNADGRSKQRMAISQFSKILGATPKSIVSAISDAGIPVRDNASRSELIEIIRKNPRNRKLQYHLGTLIVAQAQAEGENFNLFGKKEDGTPRGGTKLFSQIGGIFKKKNADNPASGQPSTGTGTEKKGFFKRLFGSNKDAQGNKQPSKFGSWFNKNSKAIGDVGNSVLGGLLGQKGSQDANQQAQYYANQQGAGGTQGRGGMGKTILIGVLALGVIGGIVYFVRKKK